MRTDLQRLLLLFAILILSSNLYSQTGKLKGRVTDAQTGDPLPGSNLIFTELSIGAATDFEGDYLISAIPVGTHKLKVSYLGMNTKMIDVTIVANRTLEFDIELNPEVIEGEEVLITAQASAQQQAMNQQLTSRTIKNIVSSKQIEQLPEANAAEAVGRLPGISLQRSGGEGNKVVIRGLAPEYNRVQIDGIDMASTDSYDRSSDLSMISPYMLGGIEVTKSAMPNQNANQLGGTVNFVLKGAPNRPPSTQILAEGGYNDLRSEFKDYKFVVQHSRRLFDGKLGMSLVGDVERKNRSSNSVGVGYAYSSEDDETRISSLSMEDVTRHLNRYNGSVVLDYKTETTDIKFSNMFSRADRETIYRSEALSGLQSRSERNQNITYSESTNDVFMSKLNLKQEIDNLLIDVSVSYTFSNSDTPEQFSFGGNEGTVLKPGVNKISFGTKPEDIPALTSEDVSQSILDRMNIADIITEENEFAAKLNIKYDLSFTNNISLELNAGGEYRHKNKEYDYNEIFLDISQDPSQLINNSLLQKYPWMEDYLVFNEFPYAPFIDHNYDPGDFMAGDYELHRTPNLDLVRDVLYYLRDEIGVQYEGSSQPQRFVPDFHLSKMNDYNGEEDYYAAYFMPVLSISDKFTFIPGFRYEYNKTLYTGYRGNSRVQASVGYRHHELEAERTNDYFLPMIHAHYKPVKWGDIRLSYTQTLSRPSYGSFLPSFHIYSPISITYRNPKLEPAKSENWDLYFSFYGNKVGLFTIGGFVKYIDDLVYWDSRALIDEEMIVNEYGLTEEETGYTPGSFKGKSIGSFINNPNECKVWGFEIEWQSNLWYLPGLLANTVLRVNYTYNKSETYYPRTIPVYETIKKPPLPPIRVIVDNVEEPYKAPLLQQPEHILNLTLGYDYKGFSIRGAMQLKSEIFSGTAWHKEERQYTEQFTTYDLSLSQQLPIEGLSLHGNIKNLSKTQERDINRGSNFLSNGQYYGAYGSFGIKYQF